MEEIVPSIPVRRCSELIPPTWSQERVPAAYKQPLQGTLISSNCSRGCTHAHLPKTLDITCASISTTPITPLLGAQSALSEHIVPSQVSSSAENTYLPACRSNVASRVQNWVSRCAPKAPKPWITDRLLKRFQKAVTSSSKCLKKNTTRPPEYSK